MGAETAAGPGTGASVKCGRGRPFQLAEVIVASGMMETVPGSAIWPLRATVLPLVTARPAR